MKTIFELGKRHSGVFLSSLLALCILLVGCAKEPPVEPDPIDPPADTTLKLYFDGISVPGTYTVQMNEGESCNLKWNNGGKNMTILRDDKFFSNQSKGDTTFVVGKTTTFKFLDAFGKELPQKIGITVKTEIILPRIISFTASSYSIVIGDSVILTLVYSNGDTNVITSSPITTLKSMSTDSVRHLKDKPTVSTKYSALVWNIFGTDTLSLTIVVTVPPPPTNKDYLCNHPLPWKHSKEYYKYYEENQYDSLILSSYELSQRTYFYQNSWHETFKPGHVLMNNGSYTINDSVLVWGMLYKIIYLNYDLMILERVEIYPSSPSGQITWRSVYIRSPEE